MAAQGASKTTLHGTYIPAHSLDLTKKQQVQNLAIPQKRALLNYYVAVATTDEIKALLPAASNARAMGAPADRSARSVHEKRRNIRPVDHRTSDPLPIKEGGEPQPTALTPLLRAKIGAEIAQMPLAALDKAIAVIDLKKLLATSAVATAAAAAVTAPPNVQNSTVGFVLYEKLTYFDKGIVKTDDVVSQFILPPGAEVEMATKSWSKVSIDFEDSQTQLTEEETEGSLSQNREISEATSKQEQYSMSLSTSFQGQGNWGVYKATANAASNLAAAVTVSRQESTKEKQETTQKAASRARREHKLTIKRSTELGREVVRTERFRNSNDFHPVVYKFFKAAKEWEIRHEVHGVALCADVMVRNPGVNLRSLLQAKFDPNAVPPLNIYYLPEDIEPEPPAVTTSTQTISFGNTRGRRAFVFLIPKGYTLDHVMGIGNSGRVQFEGGHDDMIPANSLGLWTHPDLSGHRVLNYRGSGPESSTVTLTAIFRRKADIFDAWKVYAENKFRDIHRKQWQLEQDVAEATKRAFDTDRSTPVRQILRQEERNELASGVARFLLTGVADPEPWSDETVAINTNLGPAAGRLISIIHHAFEWHNASYFLYPYWWDFSVFRDMTFKEVLELDHRDSLRKSFLQASWARVLVPVRADAERTVLGLMYGQGTLDAIDRKLQDDTDVPTAHAAIVEAYVSLHRERITGRLKQNDNLEHEDPLADSNVKQPNPITLAKWTEYTPTDETFAEMQILGDATGLPVNLGEETARKSKDLHIAGRAAVVDLLTDAMGKLEGVKISYDAGSEDTATIESRVDNS